MRKCDHVQCTALCGEKCTTKPCTKPCENVLPCGHKCIGFCGDPCPPLCRICNKNELQEFILGHEDEDDARFVLLTECKHVIESKGMETWLEQKGKEHKEVVPKTCPRCKTLLVTTQRYSDYIKDTMNDVIKVKEKFFGTLTENMNEQRKLLNLIKRLQGMSYSNYTGKL